jgi:hypothetical protein
VYGNFLKFSDMEKDKMDFWQEQFYKLLEISSVKIAGLQSNTTNNMANDKSKNDPNIDHLKRSGKQLSENPARSARVDKIELSLAIKMIAKLQDDNASLLKIIEDYKQKFGDLPAKISTNTDQK